MQSQKFRKKWKIYLWSASHVPHLTHKKMVDSYQFRWNYISFSNVVFTEYRKNGNESIIICRHIHTMHMHTVMNNIKSVIWSFFLFSSCLGYIFYQINKTKFHCPKLTSKTYFVTLSMNSNKCRPLTKYK